MAKRELPTAAYVRSILHYDPETGVLTWRARPREHFKTPRSCNAWNARFALAVAGFDGGDGYLRIGIDGKPYLAHRIAWLYMTGAEPEGQIDHVDLNKSNNKFTNMRIASYSENQMNTRIRPNNTSGAKGVYWEASRGKWRAGIVIRGKKKFIGRYNSIEEASASYASAAQKLHGDFARSG